MYIRVGHFLSKEFTTHGHCSQFEGMGEQRKGAYCGNVSFGLARCSSVLMILTAVLMHC